MTRPECIDAIFERFAQYGHRAYGEDVTEMQHALQTATFAMRGDEPDVVVAAALLHDYGHLCHDAGEDVADRGVDARHEELGAAALEELFDERVIAGVRWHVDAKRYLCARDDAYERALSPASRQSLALQGGAMTAAECMRFERLPGSDIAVRVRRYDDAGKVVAMATAALSSFLPLLMRLLRRAT